MNNTTLSLLSINFDSISFSAAVIVAAASGATIIPSVFAILYIASLISESSTAIALPFDSLKVFNERLLFIIESMEFDDNVRKVVNVPSTSVLSVERVRPDRND